MKTTTTHRCTIVGRCPHGCPDLYTAEFTVEDRVLRVEDIRAEIDTLTNEPIYQEDLTRLLAERLNCVVVTTGPHGIFETRCRSVPGA
jgi:hypothetical protein